MIDWEGKQGLAIWMLNWMLHWAVLVLIVLAIIGIYK